MPELQQSASSVAAIPAAVESPAVAVGDELDFALGCECADPALQIERWPQEAGAQQAG